MHQVVFFNSMFYVRVLPYTWKECSLKFPKGSPHELPIFRQSLQWRMYHVPYSMSGFLQLIADGSPNKHQRKKKSKGRNRREYKRTPSRKHSVNNFWIRIVERNRFPELTSFWLRFVLKECSLKFTKGPPHKLRNFRQSLTDVPCSSIFYVWVSAADNWWQPKQTSRKKGKARGASSGHPAIASAKRVAALFPCWNHRCPFAELIWITGSCSNPCFCQKPKKIYFPGSKWIAGNILCIGFFTDSGRCFVRPKLSILCSMYPI